MLRKREREREREGEGERERGREREGGGEIPIYMPGTSSFQQIDMRECLFLHTPMRHKVKLQYQLHVSIESTININEYYYSEVVHAHLKIVVRSKTVRLCNGACVEVIPCCCDAWSMVLHPSQLFPVCKVHVYLLY